jgi:hypothetical protein
LKNLNGTITIRHLKMQKAVGCRVNSVKLTRVLGASCVNVTKNGALHMLSNVLSKHVRNVDNIRFRAAYGSTKKTKSYPRM